jgi:Zn-dependent protease
MNLHIVLILFQVAVLLFALSLHEAAHGWMASRLGDQTARMLGRITLNPLPHIDMVGTILVPALSVFAGWPLIGWAKPTPVNTRNFKNFVRDDVMTTLAGPGSNLLMALAALVVLLVLKLVSAHTVVAAIVSVQMGVADAGVVNGSPVIFPLSLLLYYAVFLNLLLVAFNLLPLPPLDGSHLLHDFDLRLWRTPDWTVFESGHGALQSHSAYAVACPASTVRVGRRTRRRAQIPVPSGRKHPK